MIIVITFFGENKNMIMINVRCFGWFGLSYAFNMDD
jgi:hypothetical protein